MERVPQSERLRRRARSPTADLHRHVQRGAYEIVHQQELEDPVSATPAIDALTIYIRTATKLFAFGTDEKSE